VQGTALAPTSESNTGLASAKSRPRVAAKPVTKLPLRAVMEQALLRQVTPPSLLVNGSGEVLYVHGHTGLFLEPSQGEVGVQNILKMSHPELRSTLTMALRQVQKNVHILKTKQFKFLVQGLAHYADITVQRLARGHVEATDQALFLVTLEERPAPPSTLLPELPVSDADLANIQSLTQALREKDDYLQSTQEALESANEELQSSVEEMQSVNEELQSANEELETSKEELQSVNEELATVNTELQTKVNDLSRSNNDMNNLLAGTGVGTVFVDMHLKILRFTPAVAAIMNLIPSDLGRSVSHIASNLVGYTRLVADVKAVLHSLEPMAQEVQTTEDTWYTLHIQPYRTLSNVVEGAVISFENITEMVRARAALEKANALLRLAVVDAKGAEAGS
jgi:two-component system CheB/CheR fusion protein